MNIELDDDFGLAIIGLILAATRTLKNKETNWENKTKSELIKEIERLEDYSERMDESLMYLIGYYFEQTDLDTNLKNRLEKLTKKFKQHSVKGIRDLEQALHLLEGGFNSSAFFRLGKTIEKLYVSKYNENMKYNAILEMCKGKGIITETEKAKLEMIKVFRNKDAHEEIDEIQGHEKLGLFILAIEVIEKLIKE